MMNFFALGGISAMESSEGEKCTCHASRFGRGCQAVVETAGTYADLDV
jgi:hypothetical protein